MNSYSDNELKRISFDGKLFIAVLLIIIFEGALRKWLSVPSSLLILMRDMLVCILIARTFISGKLNRMPGLSKFIIFYSIFFIFYSLLQIAFNNTSPVLLVIGMRFWLLYLIFALSACCSLNEYDIKVSLKILLAISLLMTPLAFAQAYFPPSHIINYLPDTDIENIFILAGNIVRVSGTFSFTLGYTCFIALILPFAILNSWKGERLLKFSYANTILILSIIILTLFSGSRASIVWFGVFFIFYLLSRLLSKPDSSSIKQTIFMLTLLSMGGVVILLWFQDNIDAYFSRFESASINENFFERVIVMLFGEPHVMEEFNLLGHGFGLGSNAGAVYEIGRIQFLLAESEPGRIMLEGGIFGILWILIKLFFSIFMIIFSLMTIRKNNDFLPLLLSISCFYGFSSWAVSGQLSAHGIAYIMLSYLFFLIREYKYKIRLN